MEQDDLIGLQRQVGGCFEDFSGTVWLREVVDLRGNIIGQRHGVHAAGEIGVLVLLSLRTHKATPCSLSRPGMLIRPVKSGCLLPCGFPRFWPAMKLPRGGASLIVFVPLFEGYDDNSHAFRQSARLNLRHTSRKPLPVRFGGQEVCGA